MLPSAEKVQYESMGFLHLPGMIPPPLVARVRAAFNEAASEYEAHWLQHVKDGKAHPGFYDLPDVLDADDCFVDLVDLPALQPYLLELVGRDVQLNHTHARVFPPGKTFTAPWHSDLADVLGVDLGHSLNFFVKVHFYFEDLRPDQGCLAFIPGSHRFPPDHPRPQISDSATSPAVVKIVPRAGDLVLFNTHCLHMALNNDSPSVRKSLIYAYSHFWVKNYANAVPRDLERLATTQLRKQLFGIEDEGVSYFDQRYHENVKPTILGTFWSAASRLMKRLRKKSSITTKK